MAIKVGESLPLDVKLKEMGEAGPRDVSVGDIFRGKRVVLFAVPGAFTPTCSMKHLPGFVSGAQNVKAKGVDEVVCLSVNDAFVMDAGGFGMGKRSQRYAMVVKDGKVEQLHVEPGGGLNVSSCEAVLGKL